MMTLDAKKYSLGAAALGALAAGFELVRLVLAPRRVPGFDVGTTDVLALVFIGLLAAGAIGLATHKGFGPVVAALGGIAAMGYGAAALAGRAHWGIVYIVAGGAILYGLGKATPYLRTASA